MNKYLSITSLALCLSVAGSSQSVDKLRMPRSESIIALLNKHSVPVAGISIIEGDSIFTAVFGDLPHHSPAPLNTLFNLASVTKPVTAAVTLMLVSQRRWDLDEPLYHYWIDPDVAWDARHKKLTTRHVLSHQSGLPNWRGHEPGGKLSFSFEPGTQWKYAGEGFEYLRKAMEQKFHVPFEKIVDSLLFTPLGMNDSRFYWDESMDPTLYANRHREDGSPYEIETWHEANPSNLLLTTVGDYSKFCRALMNLDLFDSITFQQMVSPQSQSEDDRQWGLGWRLVRIPGNGEYVIVHTGSNPGIHTIVMLIPGSKRGIIVFTNGANGDKVYREIIQDCWPDGKAILHGLE